MNPREVANIVRLGPRIPSSAPIIGTMESIINIAVPNRVVEPRADETTSTSTSTDTNNCGKNECEKPVSSSTFTLPIILGVVIPVVAAAILFIYLQRRHVKKQREEDANDRHASMDFGLGTVPPGKTGGAPEMIYGEKGGNGRSRSQVSLDLGVNSPYLLPPELQNSRESLHSLSRTIHQNEDPYRPVSQYHPGDIASVRSQSKQGSSIYTGSSTAPSRLQELGTTGLLSDAGPMPRSDPATAFVPPPRQDSSPQNNKATTPVDSVANSPLPPPPYPVEPPQAHLPGSSGSPPRDVQRKGLPTNPRPGQNLAPMPAELADNRESYASDGDAASFRQSNNYLGAFMNADDPALKTPSKSPEPEIQRKPPPPAIQNSLPSNPRPVRKDSMPVAQQTYVEDGSDYGDGFKVTPPSPGHNQKENVRASRYSMDVPPEQFAQAGLGAPEFDPRRLSMGFRPLPPNTATESDDPEIRANRIRSFYKEYFDDSKPAPQGQYYEDYDENYLGADPYYDPDSNAFVMPYAEPVSRRAMTPPPGGARGPRFQGVPRPRNGSMGAMSVGGGRGPPRFPPGPRAFSSASGRMGPGPRGTPKRPLPPPADLTSLPTPSKLKDDSFALMGAIEFAPPQTYRDRAAGRSESPFGERRPYSPAVPSFAPIVSAFDELAPVPSPHMLRKSGTFTALDFAPPKKFRDPDSMSDSGSIRSNRSGVSAAQLGAIRNGAYRVSRIPQEVVFTKDDLATSLKPQWGMRAHDGKS